MMSYDVMCIFLHESLMSYDVMCIFLTNSTSGSVQATRVAVHYAGTYFSEFVCMFNHQHFVHPVYSPTFN